MEKYKLKDGGNIFVVRVEHNVTLRTFCIALTDKFYNENKFFPIKITKKEAEKILRRGLFFSGINGQYEDGYFDSSFEESGMRNEIYEKATEWVKLKYDWLR